MSEIANEQDTSFEDDVELTDAQLDAEFDTDDDAEDTGADDKGVLTLGDDNPDDAAATEGDKKAEADKAAADAEAEADKAAAEATEAKPATTKSAETATKEPTDEEKEAAQKAATEAALADSKNFAESMFDRLKDIEIGDGGTDDAPMPATLGEFAEQFPEIAAVTQAMVADLRKELLSTMQPMQQMIQTQEVTAAQQALFTELASDDFGHQDAGEIIGSDAFEQWADKQTPAFQKFIDSVSTAQDAAPILAKFKADTGVESKSPGQATAEKQRAAKAARDKLHSASTRTRKSVQTSGSGSNTEEDLDKLFNEDDGDDEV